MLKSFKNKLKPDKVASKAPYSRKNVYAQHTMQQTYYEHFWLITISGWLRVKTAAVTQWATAANRLRQTEICEQVGH